MLDELLFSDTFNILTMIDKINSKDKELTQLINYIKEYFEAMQFTFEGKKHIVLFDKDVVLYVLDGETWTAIEDIIFARYRKKNKEFSDILEKTYSLKTELNTIIGSFKIAGRGASAGINVFKIIDLTVSGTGSRCSDKPSSQIMTITKKLDPGFKKIFTAPYIETSEGFCVYNEIFLRLIDMQESPKKRYFLSNVEHALIAPKKRK